MFIGYVFYDILGKTDMPKLLVNLSATLHASAQARVRESGHKSLENYLKALVKADSKTIISPALESLLLKRLEGGDSVPFDTSFRKSVQAKIHQLQASRSR